MCEIADVALTEKIILTVLLQFSYVKMAPFFLDFYGFLNFLCRIAKDPRFERLPCSHKGTYADDCLVQRVTQV